MQLQLYIFSKNAVRTHPSVIVSKILTSKVGKKFCKNFLGSNFGDLQYTIPVTLKCYIISVSQALLNITVSEPTKSKNCVCCRSAKPEKTLAIQN